jgi:Kef-type K+ transport system membrane component KefB
VAGKYLLNPLFRSWPRPVREVMTAAALLVVLGAALIIKGWNVDGPRRVPGRRTARQSTIATSSADIEPFRGLLLALFFMGIGMHHGRRAPTSG